jgi:hypothetical protein
MKYNFYTDPGHGWLEVPLAELKRLGIVEKISSYSYRDGELAYLEEDCDYSVFLEAKRAAGETFETHDIYSGHSFVRFLNCFNQ